MRRFYWGVATLSVVLLVWFLVKKGNVGMINVFLAVGTWALVVVTWVLAKNAKDQMEENTRNTQEMIKENSMLSWRNSIVTTLADLFGRMEFYHAMNKGQVNKQHIQKFIEEVFCLNNKLIFLIGDNDEEIAKDIRVIVDLSIKILSIKDDPAKNDKKEKMNNKIIKLKIELAKKINASEKMEKEQGKKIK